MKKIFMAIMISAQIMTGCGTEKEAVNATNDKAFDLSGLKDGVYTAESTRDEKLGYGRLSLRIESGKITEADFKGVDLFGNVKDENYGSMLGEGDYKKAQVAVKAIASYPKQLIETQDLKKVDAISGASISYGQFVETVKKATEAAH